MSRYHKRLDEVKKNAVCVPLRPNTPYVLMSDCHRGDGNWSDSFANNKTIYLAALGEYFRDGYVYLELGDGDELWENKNMAEILEKHGEVFDLMKKFYLTKRLHMLYGNHDMVKSAGLKLPCFPDILIPESIFLKNIKNEKGILLLHGHQGDILNDKLWKLARFLVRYLWRPLEQLGVKDPTSAAKNYHKKDRVERHLAEWAKKNQQLLVAGHTHRPHFSQPESDDWYYNTGSGVHPHSITAIEIKNGYMSLVKWLQLPDSSNYIRVKKEIISGPLPIPELTE